MTTVPLRRPGSADAIGLGEILVSRRRGRFGKRALTISILAVIALALYVADLFHLARYSDASRTIFTLLRDALPPDFSRWRNWGQPLLDTLAMSVAGTVIASLAAIPLGALASGRAGLPSLAGVVRTILNIFRSIPLVVWGIACVAAVGFGALPGALALAIHSTGMLGEFYAEILEHVDPVPGDALKSQGVSSLGVMRFAVLPQILPRAVDVTLYRWEHNVRAATVMGVIGAGGIGLEIMSAFQLFEYREALALILLLFVLVTGINAISKRARSRFLDRTT
ncbi:MAG TPA: phosphonate ABC transporter, permease protein PhnE [Thermoanaerobaculia bacterium]|nr:phosphonate ABC transporter, permease protein PhnE [Thermoanaerobaculia bacterium]